MHDIYISDIGSFSTSFDDSTLISNREGMLQFVDKTKCLPDSMHCHQLCKATCFRSFRFDVDSTTPPDTTLQVCKSGEKLVFELPANRGTVLVDPETSVQRALACWEL